MSLNRSVTASAAAALLIALTAIAVISYSGIPAVRITSTPSGVTNGSPSTTITTSPTNSAGTASPQGHGTLSLLLTDPPRVPPGVTAVYVYYIGLAVHGAQGWTVVKSAGEIELLGTFNFAQTLSSADLPGGYYDSVRFSVASAQVTYFGANHTAVVQGGDLTVRIEGDTLVSTSQAAAALIDIQPTVIDVGTATAPQFVLWANARAFQVPQAQVSSEVAYEGHRLSLSGLGWWSDDEAKFSAVLQLSGASLSSGSFNLNVKDTGTSDAWLKMVVISMASPVPLQNMPEAEPVPPSMAGSAVFVVLSNGTLVQFLPLIHMTTRFPSGDSQLSIYDSLLGAGYNLTAGSSVSLTYSGSIELSFGLLTQPLGITPGTTYWVTVIGFDAVATTSVTAS